MFPGTADRPGTVRSSPGARCWTRASHLRRRREVDRSGRFALHSEMGRRVDHLQLLEQAETVLLEPDFGYLAALGPVHCDAGPLDRVAGRFDVAVLPGVGSADGVPDRDGVVFRDHRLGTPRVIGKRRKVGVEEVEYLVDPVEFLVDSVLDDVVGKQLGHRVPVLLVERLQVVADDVPF